MGSIILLVLIILLAVIVAHAAVLAWAIGIGWILTQFLPFTLFEGSLLGLISAAMVIFGIYRLFSSGAPSPFSDYDDDDDIFDILDEYDSIPESRFYKNEADKTWEAWTRHEIANGVYQEMQEEPSTFGSMGERQLQELAIRLADIGIATLKKKAKNRSLKVTIANLRSQMNRMKQRPYDDDILEVAVEAINDELEYEETIDVIRDKLWNEPCDMFD